MKVVFNFEFLTLYYNVLTNKCQMSSICSHIHTFLLFTLFLLKQYWEYIITFEETFQTVTMLQKIVYKCCHHAIIKPYNKILYPKVYLMYIG